MNRVCFSLFFCILCISCINLPQNESQVCKQIRREMAYLKRTGGLKIDPKYFQLSKIYQEYDCH